MPSEQFMSITDRYYFQLYVADTGPNSAQAIKNLHALCTTHLAGRHEIEMIDVFKQPIRALTEGILMTPTLIKLAPAPICRIVGTLSQVDIVLDALGLEPTQA